MRKQWAVVGLAWLALVQGCGSSTGVGEPDGERHDIKGIQIGDRLGKVQKATGNLECMTSDEVLTKLRAGEVTAHQKAYYTYTDKTCVDRQTTYGKAPASIEFGFKSGKVVMITVDVEASANDVMEGLAMKYGDGSPSALAFAMPFVFMAGLPDADGNVLVVREKRGDARVVLLREDVQSLLAQADAKVRSEQSGAEDM